MERVAKTNSMEEVMELMEPLTSAWFNERFDRLTEPQAKAIPEIHKRKNVLVSSPTGSGKTLTAFTSIINELTRYASEGKLEERIYCIYISPLKALANDINRNLNAPLAEMKEVAAAQGMNIPDIRVAVRTGDTPQSERQKMVKHPPHILITTPESLALILAAPKFKESFRKIEWVILDEIHDICDSKRGAFLSLTLERLKEHCETEFSRIGLSATLAPIEAIAGYLVGCEPDGQMRDVTLIEADSKKELDLKVICPTDDMTALSSDIVNSMMYDTLKDLVDQHETTLVFTNTRSGAESVVYKLKERGLENIEVHHSSLGRETRLDVEERLKRGEIKCVVSSTSLELGIDIGSVDLVCQIGSPKSVAKGLQRIGRSGHSYGKVAKGRLIVFDPDDLVECAVMCRAAHRGDIDRVGIPENCLDVLAQAVVGMSLDQRWDTDAAYELVKGSYCYRNLSKHSFIDILRYLGSKDEHEGVYSKIWYDEEEHQFGRKKGARMIYLMNLGTIPEEANYRVVTNHGSTAGELSEKFVERLAPKDVFVLGGRSLEFVRSKGMVAHVKEASGRKPTVPSWAGEMLPRSFDLSMDVAEFRKEMAEHLTDGSKDNVSELSAEFDIDEGSAKSLVSYFKEQKAAAGIIPDSDRLVIEEYIDPSGNQKMVFHFPFGRRVNDALSRGYAYRLSNMIGANVSVTMSDDNFMIGTPRKIDIREVPGLLKSRELDSVLRKAIKDSEIFKLRFRHTAARSFMILRNYKGRPISVNRQQVRSSYLLDTLGNMENVPVIEETYREVLEDDMDIRNAEVVLEMIENGKMGVEVFPFTGTPSPFAHSIILSGFSDIVLMEDRTELLKELHRKVLYRALGDSVKDFEFDEDTVIPYFRQKIGRVASKEDIVPMLMRTGPLQAIRERGRNIYAYCDEDKKVVDGWIRELLKEGQIGTVFLDEPCIMAGSEIQTYAAAVAKTRELSEFDSKVYEKIGERTALSDITAALEASEDAVFRSMRKLESMYLAKRVDINANNKWYFSKAKCLRSDKNRCLDEIAFRYLDCFAPATVPEVAFALSVSEDEARNALDSLTNSGEVVKGQFLISESPQYMKMLDRMRLRAGKENIYDYDTVEEYRRTKGEHFDTIRDYFKFYGSAGSEIDVFNRVKGFDLKEWYDMRESEELLLGRFVRGKVRYVLAEDGDRLAALRPSEATTSDEELMSVISGLGQTTMRNLAAATDRDKTEIKEAIQRLDRSLRVIRAFDEREDWATENTYKPYYPNKLIEDPTADLVKSYIRSYGPIPAQALRFLIGASGEDIEKHAISAGAETIFVGGGQNQMYIMPDEIPKLKRSRKRVENVTVRSLHDPELGSKWSELVARYGDRWIYPLTKGNMVVGALELWEMSGCIEIRSMDADSPGLLPEILKAIDRLMEFYSMKGVDTVRIREILGVDATELDQVKLDILKDNGYIFVNGFFAKGNITGKTMTESEYLSYTFKKQRVAKGKKYQTVDEVVEARGYIRGDQEMVTRVEQKIPLKNVLNKGGLFKTPLLPEFMGYTTPETASLYRAAKEEDLEEDAKIIIKIIHDRQPVSRKEIISNSPLSDRRTLEILAELSKMTVIYQDNDSYYYAVPKKNITKEEALKKVVKMHFKDFGIFSAEELAQFIHSKMAVVRKILSELEDECFLVKGFLIEDDPTLRWMIAEDSDAKPETFREMFLLNTQDNLHIHIRDMIKRECGSSKAIVFEGTDIAGSFCGKVTASGAKIEDFEGSDKAYRFIREIAKSFGVKMEEKKKEEEEDDWDVSEFYLKTNPGML